MKRILAAIFLISTLWGNGADFVIFSYDRPMQLYALLESTEKHISGVEQIAVLYRASEDSYEEGYRIVRNRFSNVHYVRQPTKYAHKNFKPLLMNILTKRCKSSHLMFAVDDIVIIDQIDLESCVEKMEKHDAEGFHLRMGKNLNYCYMLRRAQPLPAFTQAENGVLRWQFKQGESDWAYPHTVDCCLYRKEQVVKEFSKMKFINPNVLEGTWARSANLSLYGLCFERSKIVNLPLNLVNETDSNAHMESYSPEELLKFFNKEKKMDIMDLYHINNRSAHIDYEPVFIDRRDA